MHCSYTPNTHAWERTEISGNNVGSFSKMLVPKRAILPILPVHGYLQVING